MKRVFLFFFLCIQLISIPSAFAQHSDYPKRPIKLIISYEAASSEDILARYFAEQLSKSLGQEIITVNHNTLSSDVAMNMMLSNKADGYTLAITDLNPFGANAFLGDAIHYEIKEVSPLNILSSSPMAIVAKSSSSWRNFNDLMSAAKRGRRLRVAVMDNASMQMMQWIGVRNGARFLIVEQDDLANTLRMLDDNFADFAILGNVATDEKLSGKIRPIASTGLDPFPNMPNVATLKAQGYDFIYDSLAILSVSAATPDEVKDKIQSAAAKIIQSSEYQNLLKEQNLNPPIVYTADRQVIPTETALTQVVTDAYQRAITIVNRVGRKPKR